MLQTLPSILLEAGFRGRRGRYARTAPLSSDTHSRARKESHKLVVKGTYSLIHSTDLS